MGEGKSSFPNLEAPYQVTDEDVNAGRSLLGNLLDLVGWEAEQLC